MTKRKSWIYAIITYIIAFGLVLMTVLLCSKKYFYNSAITVFAYFIASAIVFGLVNAFLHEFGHVIIGKKNGFFILAVTIWFFKWTKVKNKYTFSLTMMGNEAGYTDSVPKFQENIEKRLKKMTLAGPLASLVLTVLSVVPYIFIGKIPLPVFCLLSMCLPISAYYFLWNIFPIVTDGIYNDGAIVYAINHNTDTSKVMCSLLKIQSEMYNGKTPCEIDEKLYFDLPQLAEDDLYFAYLLNARYNYYLDKEDFENAVKVEDRLLGLFDYIPKPINMVILSDSLYNECAIKKDSEKADEKMYEVENYLNKVNSLTNIRIKLAYLALIGENSETLDMFYKKGYKEAKKCQIKGLASFETKLLDKVMEKTE